jgi:hypothetical protein
MRAVSNVGRFVNGFSAMASKSADELIHRNGAAGILPMILQ